MAPTPQTTCSACGKPVDPSDKACKGCGAMIGAPSSGFSLDAEHERKPSTMAPQPTPPPAKEEPPTKHAAPADHEPELETIDLDDDAPATTPPAPAPETAPTEKTVAEKAAEKAREEPKGETVRMSLADATQAWLEDTPNTTAVIDEDIDDLVPRRGNRTLLFVILGVAAVALAALLLLL